MSSRKFGLKTVRLRLLPAMIFARMSCVTGVRSGASVRRKSWMPLLLQQRWNFAISHARAMFPALATRTFRTADKRCLWKFAWNFGVKGMLSVEKFKRRIKRGEFFPPFLYLSIINSCNLRCQGCWVDVEAQREMISADDLNRLINDAKAHGNSFF